MEKFMKKLYSYLQESVGVTLTDLQMEQFNRYYEMLVEKNKVMNLTAITEKDEVELKHFIDSVALGAYYDLTKDNIKVIDVGTGAGFPGIPLKIAFPNLNVVLFDSLNKRVKFLQEVIDELGLDGEVSPEVGKGFCKALHGRAEDGGRNKELREGFDIVVSRVVANMAVLSEYCIPFTKEGGYFIPYKTGTVDEELSQGKKAINILGGKIEKVEKLILQDSDIGRRFVFIKKVKATPKAYPRKAGTANKQPLL
ncbi:MAG: 16S rRNA (guanine(527)-N(7))-methyltransferase RsmG [Lachnospiraceae bacterium]|nr:16S rRNA (guanine(527)-N(7))-methyltransferase RsmG [Lachnospiraceae bacterium]